MNLLRNPIVVLADGALREVSPKNGKHFTTKELNDFVGGTAEMYMLPHGLQLWVDKNGREKEKPMNVMASLIWQVHTFGEGSEVPSLVIGDVLIYSPQQLS